MWHKIRVWLLGLLIDFSILYGPIWLLVWSLDKHYEITKSERPTVAEILQSQPRDDGESTPPKVKYGKN